MIRKGLNIAPVINQMGHIRVPAKDRTEHKQKRVPLHEATCFSKSLIWHCILPNWNVRILVAMLGCPV